MFDPAGDIRLDADEDGVFKISGLVSGTDYQISLLDDKDVTVTPGDGGASMITDYSTVADNAEISHHQRRFHRR